VLRIENKPTHQRLNVENVEIGPNDLSIDLLRAVYRNNQLPLTTRMRAALGAIKHEVPALLATAVVNEQSFAETLDRRLKRIAEIRSIENKTINGAATVPEPTIQPEPKPTPTPTLPSPLTRIYSSRFRRRI